MLTAWLEDGRALNWVTDNIAITNQVGGRGIVGRDGLVVICVGHQGFNPWADVFFLMDPPVAASLLDEVAVAIDSHLQRGGRVVVHCGEGVERAPLVVAWWLHTRRGLTLDEAYQHVFHARRQACDRREWIVY